MGYSNESRNIVISQGYENIAESAKFQVASLMLAPNFLGKFENPKENFGLSLHKY